MCILRCNRKPHEYVFCLDATSTLVLIKINYLSCHVMVDIGMWQANVPVKERFCFAQVLHKGPCPSCLVLTEAELNGLVDSGNVSTLFPFCLRFTHFFSTVVYQPCLYVYITYVLSINYTHHYHIVVGSYAHIDIQFSIFLCSYAL